MKKQSNGLAINGWLVIDKPAGMGSTPVVSQVKAVTQARKAGHAGTLDPFATGILPVALGNATKTMPYIVAAEKAYEFTIAWGIETDSLDCDGAVLSQDNFRPDHRKIQAMLGQFTGEIDQVPPVHSAIKIDGKRAYQRVRQGEKVTIPPRKVHIYALDFVDGTRDQARFLVRCSKGTYVRALGRDLAMALGAKGHLVQLRRLKVGAFDEKAAISLEILAQKVATKSLQDILMPAVSGLAGVAKIDIERGEAACIRSGRALSMLRKMDYARIHGLAQGETVGLVLHGEICALARFEKGLLHPVRVLS